MQCFLKLCITKKHKALCALIHFVSQLVNNTTSFSVLYFFEFFKAN